MKAQRPSGGEACSDGKPPGPCRPAVPALTYLPMTVAVPPGAWSEPGSVRLNSPVSSTTTLRRGRVITRPRKVISDGVMGP